MMKNQLQKSANSAVTTAITSLDFQGRTVRMHFDDDGNPWWVARDVCDILGLERSSLAINGRPDRPESGLPEDEKDIATVNTEGYENSAHGQQRSE